jgi:tetratricopeptide (TPR) repeat protein
MDITNQKKVNNFINSKKFDKALKLCQKALKVTPNDDVVHMIIGIIYHKTNKFSLARKSLEHARKLNPKSVATINNLSLVYDALGDYKLTISCLRDGLKLEPTNKTLLKNIAQANYVFGDHHQAAFQYKSNRLLGIVDDDTAINIINSLNYAGEHAEALAELEDYEEQLKKKKGNELKTTTELLTIDTLILKLQLLSRLGRIEEVMSLLLLVEKLELNFTYRGHLAKIYANLGDKAATRAIFLGTKFNKHTPVIDLTNYCAYSDLTEDELLQVEHYLKVNKLKDEDYYYLAMALTKQYKKRKNIEKNKYWLSAANNKMKSKNPEKGQILLLERIINSHKNQVIPYSNCQSKQPIFIVGMPRSGTTLLESMLAVHTDIHAAGELTLFGNAFKKLSPLLDNATMFEQEYRYFEMLADLTVEDLDKVADEYLKKSRTYVAHGAKYIIDKLPDNFKNLGLIHKVFPKAKVIYIKRNPISVCFSNYEQTFHLDHNYRFDLDYLADYYLKFKDMMSFWSECLPENTIYEVDYDKLVANPDSELTGLFEYLELTQPSNVLEFYRQKNVVHTASLDQVRQPLYVKETESWEAMEDIVQPLIKKLMNIN